MELTWVKSDKMPDFFIRDPVHGFIAYDDWEREIINHPAFQRLRRIRQLALTELVYPGATHTRFPHALGTMHVATRMFDAIVKRQWDYLSHDRGYDQAGISRDRQIVRLAALLHDVGHSPFSHSGEGLFPVNSEDNRRYHHEEYSASIIENIFKETIEQHQGNWNYDIKAADVADLVSGNTNLSNQSSVRRLLWRPLVTSQLDADRCDYLLRDSLHAGVSYGRYDLDRILATINLGLSESDDPVIAIEEGGWHAAEGLIIARYSMFTQVYFHHTRQALDHHVEQVLKELLGNDYDRAEFPLPDVQGLEEYLKWDDWMVLGRVARDEAGEHGEHIMNRTLYRRVYETRETPDDEEIQRFEEISARLEELVAFLGSATRPWYSLGTQDLLIVPNDSQEPKRGRPLSEYSTIVGNMKSVEQRRIYVRPSDRDQARTRLEGLI